MNDDTTRLKQDLQTIERALGLDIWTRRDVRRGLFGDLAGGAAGLFLALWNFGGGSPEAGLLIFLAILITVILVKDYGYRRNPAPSAGTQREVAFYSRFYFAGSLVIGCYYVWAQGVGMTPPVVLASTVVMVGLWYIFYAISAPSRSISIVGAVSLTACGFMLPMTDSISQMLAWLGVATCLGCWLESVLLLKALGGKSGNTGGPGNSVGPTPPVPITSPTRASRERPLPAMLPLDFNGLDSAIHGPIRLGIMTALHMDGRLDFTTLKTRLAVPDGSLNLHLRTLEEAGYIRSRKAIVGLRPKTTYTITVPGRAALAKYVQSMRLLVTALSDQVG